MRIRPLIVAGLFLLAACSSAGGPTPGGSVAGDASAAPSPSSAALVLLAPEGLAIGPDGRLYVSDFTRNRVLVVNADGSLSLIAGNGISGFSGDGGRAVDAGFQEPAGLAFDLQGNLYIADHHSHRIRRVGLDGLITTVAGTGTTGRSRGQFRGDGGPAAEANLSEPFGVEATSAGIVIGDAFNHRLRRIDANGVITTLAGNGQASVVLSGPRGTVTSPDPVVDGAPALEAPLGLPAYLAVDPAGNIYFSDRARHSVYRVDPAGTLTIVAGTGTYGFSGDGGPATAAQLDDPSGIAIGPDGSLYISDTNNQRIRRVAPGGTISTVAGTGTGGFSGDGGQAVNAALNGPAALAIDASGNLYIADQGNGRIRMISTTGIITTVAGAT